MAHGRAWTGTCIVALIGVTVGADAAQHSYASPDPSGAADSLQEVTVIAQRLKLSWLQRNERVQVISNFVYGIAALENDEAIRALPLRYARLSWGFHMSAANSSSIAWQISYGRRERR